MNVCQFYYSKKRDVVTFLFCMKIISFQDYHIFFCNRYPDIACRITFKE